MKEEGIFRLSGSAQTIKELKAAFDSGTTHFPDVDCIAGQEVDLEQIRDEHVITGILKLYFRELPGTLFTVKLGSEFKKLESEFVISAV